MKSKMVLAKRLHLKPVHSSLGFFLHTYLHEQNVLHVLSDRIGYSHHDVIPEVVGVQSERKLAFGRVRVGPVVEQLTGQRARRVDPETVQETLTLDPLLTRIEPAGTRDDEESIQSVAWRSEFVNQGFVLKQQRS